MVQSLRTRIALWRHLTPTSIPINPCTLLKEMKKEKTAKCSTHQTYLPLLVLLLSSVLVGNFQEAWHLHHFGGLVTNRKHLWKCSTNTPTQPGKNDRSKNLHNNPSTHVMHTPQATKSKTLDSPNMTTSISCPLPVQCGGGQRPESLADAPQDCSISVFSPVSSVLGQYWQKTYVDVFNKYYKIARGQWPF